MPTPHTYRIQAEICMQHAHHAKTPKHRMMMLQMAQTWLRMADEAEAMLRARALSKAS
jgi:hypothetical protein